MNTGYRMKMLRKQLGLSAERVAEEIGLSPATIYRYEKGDIKKMPGSMLEPLADLLCTTPAYLMGWTDDPENYENAEEINDLPEGWAEYFDGDMEAAVKAYRAVDADRASELVKKPASISDELDNVVADLLVKCPTKLSEAILQLSPRGLDSLLEYAEFLLKRESDESSAR